MGYTQLFSGTNAPPVACRPPCQVFMAVCMCGARSSEGIVESNDEQSRSVSSTKLQPTKKIFSLERGEIKWAPRLSVLIMSSSGELTIAQMQGLAPLPWPLPCGGLLEVSIPP